MDLVISTLICHFWKDVRHIPEFESKCFSIFSESSNIAINKALFFIEKCQDPDKLGTAKSANNTNKYVKSD